MPRSPAGYLSGTVLGRYKVGTLIGTGGMGQVYRAEDPDLRCPVALTPDRRLLAGIWRRTPESRYVLGTLTSDGHPIDMLAGYLAPTSGATIAFTQDGRTVLFTSVERVNIWKHTIGSTTSEKVTSFSDSWTIRFALSPDGQRLAMCRGAGVRDAFLIRNFK